MGLFLLFAASVVKVSVFKLQIKLTGTTLFAGHISQVCPKKGSRRKVIEYPLGGYGGTIIIFCLLIFRIPYLTGNGGPEKPQNGEIFNGIAGKPSSVVIKA
jgi:hypothetical protein